MSHSSSISSQDTLRGICLFSASMLLVPVVDTIAKYLAADMSPLYIACARYVFAALVILPIALRKFGVNIFPKQNLKSHIIRTTFIVSAMLCFFTALATVSLATTTALSMTAPIVATIVAVLVLRERLTRVKIIALALGFAGAMIIINPSFDMEIGIIYAAMAGLFYGLYMVATRVTALQSDPIKTLLFQCVFGSTVLIPLALLNWSWPTSQQLILMVLMGTISAIAHGLTISAFRYAEGSTLSPFIYLEVISATIFGYVIFADVPNLTFWIGAATIVTGGLIISMSRKDKA